MKYLLIFLSIFVLLNSKTINEDIIINFRNPRNQYISDENGVFSLRSAYEDSNDLFDSNDIEEETRFQMEISGSKTYPMECRLFKGEGKSIFLICKLEGGLQKNETITIDKPYDLTYKTHNVILEFNVKNCELYKVSYKIPFLYSSTDKKLLLMEVKINLIWNSNINLIKMNY